MLLNFTKTFTGRLNQQTKRLFARNIPNFYKYGQVKFDFKKILENMNLIEQNCKNR